MKNVLATIEERMVNFSKGQKRIGRFIIDHYDKAAFMTAKKLGDKVGVSESTVVRFATEIGFDGYPHLQRELNEVVKRNLTAAERMEVANEILGYDDIVHKVLTADIDKIKRTQEDIDVKEFDKAVQAILKAKRIYIIGLRSANTLASFLAYYLKLIYHDIVLVNAASPNQVFEEILSIEEGDLAIAITFPRYSKTTVQATKYAKENGAQVLAITDNEDAPVCSNANIKLFAKSDMVSFVDSLVAPMSLLNALIVAVGTLEQEELSKKFKKLEDIWDEYQVYQKDDEANQ